MNRQTLYTLTNLSAKQLENISQAAPHPDFTIDGATLIKYTGNATKLIIPEHITKIARFAFACNNTLEEIILPNGVTEIEAYAFLDCPALKKIFLPRTATNLHPKAFLDYEGTIYAFAILWGSGAFKGQNVEYHINKPVPNTVDKSAGKPTPLIENKNFKVQGTILESYVGTSAAPVIPKEFTAIGNRAFYSCSALKSLSIPDSITSIGKEAFGYCTSLISISLSNNITLIESKTFQNCTALTRIFLPPGITSIGDSSFMNCCALRKVNLPLTVTSIGNYIFSGCSALSEITLPSKLKTLGNDAFLNYHGKIFAPTHLENHKALQGHDVSYYQA